MTHPASGRYLTLTTDGGEAEAYLVGSPDRPGVLLFIDAIGLRPQIERMADRIASWGYTVLAPNVFWRDGTAAELAPRTDLRAPGNREAFMPGAMKRVAALTPAQVAADFPVWHAALREHSAADSAIGVTGYCMGGRLSLRFAATYPAEVAVTGMFHAGGIVVDGADSPHLVAPDVAARVVAGFADNDRSATPEQVAAFNAALTASGVTFTSVIYPDAPHGYTMADTSTYQEAGAERHFTELRGALDSGIDSAL
ncbi:dienelactone hydrolase family protein [Microbacterium gorillae]|uniref:dienelactone hydrolase family protein n=1 Tax=Microbacterium gorillae TaxID=1231063 RepID=UPI00058FCDE7|nr:dienelactone hydrolase family protein [Microbacterium gorillae]